MIDSRAAVDPAAELEEGVSVGPFAVIGPGVRIGRGTTVGSHAVIRGPTTIGADNRIYQFASVGEDPQDKKYGGEETALEIGDRNVIREYATLHRGTAQGGGVTRIGDGNLLMAYTHVAHDCRLGDNVIMANGATLAGHVDIGDFAILGGFTLVHQFCAIGAHALTAFGSGISKDVPPYMTVGGSPARVHGMNMEGLRRRGFSADSRSVLKAAYKTLYRENLSLQDALLQLQQQAADHGELEILVSFLERQTRGIVR